MKSILPALLLTAFLVNSSPATLYLNEDFGSYANGNLVGQNGWVQVGSNSANPIQVTAGQVYLPGFNSNTSQDASLSFTGLNAVPGQTAYYGLNLLVPSGGSNGAGFTAAYFTGLFSTSTTFVNARMSVRNIDNNEYSFAGRPTGQGSNPWEDTDVILPFGLQEVTLLMGYTFHDPLDPNSADIMRIWVNPGSTPGTPNLVYENQGGQNDVGFDRVVLSQFTFDGEYLINRIAIGDDFGEVYLAVIPEPGSGTLFLSAAALMALLRRRHLP